MSGFKIGRDGRRLSAWPPLRLENTKLRGVVDGLRKSLRDIVENFDCEYVEVDRLRGHHDCQHCLAKKALSESAGVMDGK